MAKKTLYDEEGNPVEVDFQDGDDNGPAELRKALKREKDAREAAATENAQLKNQLREINVKSVLASKGVPEKIAKFIPSDLVAPEQIDGWLTENSDIFGFKVEPQSENDDNQNQEQMQGFQRIQAATQTAITPDKQNDLIQKLNNPNLTKGELDALRLGAESGLGRRRY